MTITDINKSQFKQMIDSITHLQTWAWLEFDGADVRPELDRAYSESKLNKAHVV